MRRDFFGTIIELLELPVPLKGDSSWVDVLSTITKHYNKKKSSTKFTPIQACLKTNEKVVYRKFSDERKRIKPKFENHEFVRWADLKKTFLKRRHNKVFIYIL